MMLIKLGLIVKSRNALIKLNNTEGLDSITAYRILKNSNAIDKELKIYDEHQTKLVNKYCDKSEDGKPLVENGGFKVTGKNYEKYVEELESIFNEDVDISIKRISIESIMNAGLSPAQIGSIEYMLVLENAEREE